MPRGKAGGAVPRGNKADEEQRCSYYKTYGEMQCIALSSEVFSDITNIERY